MKLDASFFRWLRFFVQVLKMLVNTFGDDDEKIELKKNGFE